MRLTTKARYAINAMLEIAVSDSNRAVTIAEIAKNQVISVSYLEQLFACLRSKGLVRGVRGPGGGYYLGLAADQITIAQIICAVDEWVEHTHKKNRDDCQDGTKPSTHILWDDLSNEIFVFLDGITLSKLIARGGLSESSFSQRQRTDETQKLNVTETKAA